MSQPRKMKKKSIKPQQEIEAKKTVENQNTVLQALRDDPSLISGVQITSDVAFYELVEKVMNHLDTWHGFITIKYFDRNVTEVTVNTDPSLTDGVAIRFDIKLEDNIDSKLRPAMFASQLLLGLIRAQQAKPKLIHERYSWDEISGSDIW